MSLDEYWRKQGEDLRENFLSTVAEDIGVTYVSGDRNAATILRLAYSVAGRNALAALWDAREEDETTPPPWRRDEEATTDSEQSGTSVRRFRERVAETLRIFLDLFANSLVGRAGFGDATSGGQTLEGETTFVENATDYIFELYRRNGFFYRSPYYVAPPIKTVAGVGEAFAFVRGVAPCDLVSVAGLGTYWTPRRNFDKEAEEASGGSWRESRERGDVGLASANWRKSVAEMFAVDVSPLKERFKTMTQRLVFTESDVDESALEFLETNLERERKGRKTRARYWKLSPDVDDERVSLARIPKNLSTGADAVYFWTRVENGRRRYRQIPSWQTVNGEWRSLANATLASRDALPPTTFKRRGGGLVEFNVGYLAPPSEQNFLELYSWPLDWTRFQENARKIDRFRRETTESVFDAARSVLEPLGYSFKESV